LIGKLTLVPGAGIEALASTNSATQACDGQTSVN